MLIFVYSPASQCPPTIRPRSCPTSRLLQREAVKQINCTIILTTSCTPGFQIAEIVPRCARSAYICLDSSTVRFVVFRSSPAYSGSFDSFDPAFIPAIYMLVPSTTKTPSYCVDRGVGVPAGCNEARPKGRRDQGRSLPIGRNLLQTGVRTGSHYLISLSVCLSVYVQHSSFLLIRGAVRGRFPQTRDLWKRASMG